MKQSTLWMRFQVIIMICWAVSLVCSVTYVVVGTVPFARVMMGFVSLCNLFSLYIDVRKYLDARTAS